MSHREAATERQYFNHGGIKDDLNLIVFNSSLLELVVHTLLLPHIQSNPSVKLALAD